METTVARSCPAKHATSRGDGDAASLAPVASEKR